MSSFCSLSELGWYLLKQDWFWHLETILNGCPSYPQTMVRILTCASENPSVPQHHNRLSNKKLGFSYSIAFEKFMIIAKSTR